MSFPRVLVTTCRELLTLAPRIPFTGGGGREPRRPGRVAVVGGVLFVLSVGLWALWTYFGRRDMWHMLDLSVYHDAAHAFRNDDNSMYTENYGYWKGKKLPFIYPPFSGLLFYVLLPLGFTGLKWFMAIGSMLALFAVVWAAWGMLGYRRGLGRLGVSAATFAAVLWLEPVEWTLVWGQINVLLLALVVLDLALPDSRRYKGIGVGVAAGLKLTPAIFIVYLLITRRFRAAGVATGAFAATVVVGLVTAPAASAYYWSHIVSISGKVNDQLSVGTLNNQSVQGMFTRMLGEGGAATGLWLLVCLIVGALGLLAAARASLRGDELVGVVITGGLSLFVSPISWSHHWVWIVPAFVLLVHTAVIRARPLWWWLTGVFFLYFAAWPLRLNTGGDWDGGQTLQPWGLIWLAPRDNSREEHWTPIEFLLGNGYLFAGIALTLVLVAAILRDRTPLPTPLTPREPAATPDRVSSTAR
ncbi:glycosyltransferase 87 family protein [Embleya sp. NBC_00896]|uniref:glycosyltransferase 87 family protein n=1 Tax=Embleya sp. NBC_00896 TaxID=2975961 RepID=UPI00386C1644|nr:glycosyltransferase 87 family protein [Embleya sp. NBC_00896]